MKVFASGMPPTVSGLVYESTSLFKFSESALGRTFWLVGGMERRTYLGISTVNLTNLSLLFFQSSERKCGESQPTLHYP